MAQLQYDCETEDDHRYKFEVRTEADCSTHCKLHQTQQNNTELQVKVQNKTDSSFWVSVFPESKTKNTNISPSSHGCEEVNAHDNSVFTFSLFHQGQPGNVDTIDIEVKFGRVQAYCESDQIRRDMDIDIRPKFEYK